MVAIELRFYREGESGKVKIYLERSKGGEIQRTWYNRRDRMREKREIKEQKDNMKRQGESELEGRMQEETKQEKMLQDNNREENIKEDSRRWRDYERNWRVKVRGKKTRGKRETPQKDDSSENRRGLDGR